MRPKSNKYHLVYWLEEIETGDFYIGRHSTNIPYDNYYGSGRGLGSKATRETRFIKHVIQIFKDYDMSVVLEMALIDKFLNTPGCLNRCIPDVINGIGCYSIETRARMSEAKKTHWQDPHFRAKRKAAVKSAWTPEHRVAHSARLKVATDNPEWKTRRSAAARAQWKDPEVRARSEASLKSAWNKSGRREAHSELHKSLWADPQYKARVNAAQYESQYAAKAG